MNCVDLPTLIKETGNCEERIMTTSDRTKYLPDTKVKECQDSHKIYSFNLNSSLFFENNFFFAILLKITE